MPFVLNPASIVHRMRHRRFVLALILLLVIGLSQQACSRPSDEEQIRATLVQMQVAIESADPAEFMSYIAMDFTADGGAIERTALHNLLRGQVLANSRIGIGLGAIDVELQGDRAAVRVAATLTGGNGRWIPERGSILQITSGWRKLDGMWQCVNAQWEQTL